MADDTKPPAKTMLGWLPTAPPAPAPNAAPPAPTGFAPPSGYPYAPASPPSASSYPQTPAATGLAPPSGYPHAPASPPPASSSPQASAYAPPASGYPQAPAAAGFAPPYPQVPQASGHPPHQPAPYAGYPPPSSPSPYPQAQPGYPQARSGWVTPSPSSPPPQLAPDAYAGYGAAGGSPTPAAHAGYGVTGVSPAAAAYAQRAIPHANATVGISDRVAFIRKTYLHLLGAILVFAGLLYLLFSNVFLVGHVSAPLVKFAFGARWNWLVVLGAFMAVSWLADYWASHATSRGTQYAGLAIYVVAESLIFVPLLAIVQARTAEILARGGHEPHIIRDAAFTTLAIFGALTASVLISKKDFSWMRSGLAMFGAAATMLVVLSVLFGFSLGIVFSVAMVVLAGGYILYQTSGVLAHYDPRQHVAAALALFSSIALLFWYVIRIFLRARR